MYYDAFSVYYDAFSMYNEAFSYITNKIYSTVPLRRNIEDLRSKKGLSKEMKGKFLHLHLLSIQFKTVSGICIYSLTAINLKKSNFLDISRNIYFADNDFIFHVLTITMYFFPLDHVCIILFIGMLLLI